MKWTRVDQWHYARACGRYTVDVIKAATSATGQRCTAWRRSQAVSEMATNLGCFDRLQDAFGACAADLRARTNGAEGNPDE